MNSKPNVIFYYRSKQIGGIQKLYGFLIDQLLNDGFIVTVIDDGNSYLRENLNKNKLLNFYNYKKMGRFDASSNAIVILSISYLLRYLFVIKPHKKTKLLFWDFHPLHAINITLFNRLKLKKDNILVNILILLEKPFLKLLKKLMVISSNNNGLYYMSGKNYRINARLFGLDFKANYLPVPVEISLSKENRFDKKKDVINICWISRLEKDKTQLLELLLNDLSQIENLNIRLHVIGDGDQKKYLINNCKNLNYETLFCGVLVGDSLKKYLIDNIDIGFSVGMAALEFASCKIPTVLLPSVTDIDFFKKSDKKYLWLFDSKDYGVSIESELYENYESLDDIIQHFNNEANSISETCYNYVVKNHSKESVYNLFREAITTCSNYFKDISLYKFAVRNLLSIPYIVIHFIIKEYKANLNSRK